MLFRSDVDRKSGRISLTVHPSEGVSNDLVLEYAKSGGNNLGSVVYNVFPIGTGNPFVPTNFLYSPAVDALLGPGAWAQYLAAHPRVAPEGIVAFTANQQKRGPYTIATDGLNFHRSEDVTLSNITTVDLGADLKIGRAHV